MTPWHLGKDAMVQIYATEQIWVSYHFTLAQKEKTPILKAKVKAH